LLFFICTIADKVPGSLIWYGSQPIIDLDKSTYM